MEETARDMQLLDGRRVQVRDLLEAQLIEPNTNLVFNRPRLGNSYTATITESGRIRLDNGHEFATPSRAAMEAANLDSIDGWGAWTIADTGRTLSDIRRDLLSNLNDEIRQTESDSGTAPTLSSRHEALQGYFESAESKPRKISVKDLLNLWGAQRRGQHVVGRIEAGLSNYGLETKPDFTEVALEGTVALIRQTTEDDTQTATSKQQHRSTSDRHRGIKLGNFEPATRAAESIRSHGTIQQALTIMLLDDYSQLPVLTDNDELDGVVTWRSIAEALAHSANADLSDATKPAHPSPFFRELTEVTGQLMRDDFVLVTTTTGEVGIVTTADVVEQYGTSATPFFLVGEIDHTLREAIAEHWTPENIAEFIRSKKPKSHDDLTFGNYCRILEDEERFGELGWPLDCDTFSKRLNEVRKTRNSIAHFDLDPLEDYKLESLQNFVKTLRDLTHKTSK